MRHWTIGRWSFYDERDLRAGVAARILERAAALDLVDPAKAADHRIAAASLTTRRIPRPRVLTVPRKLPGT